MVYRGGHASRLKPPSLRACFRIKEKCLASPSLQKTLSEKPIFYEIMVCCSPRGSGRVANHLGLPELFNFSIEGPISWKTP